MLKYKKENQDTVSLMMTNVHLGWSPLFINNIIERAPLQVIRTCYCVPLQNRKNCIECGVNITYIGTVENWIIYKVLILFCCNVLPISNSSIYSLCNYIVAFSVCNSTVAKYFVGWIKCSLINHPGFIWYLGCQWK